MSKDNEDITKEVVRNKVIDKIYNLLNEMENVDISYAKDLSITILNLAQSYENLTDIIRTNIK